MAPGSGGPSFGFGVEDIGCRLRLYQPVWGFEAEGGVVRGLGGCGIAMCCPSDDDARGDGAVKGP